MEAIAAQTPFRADTPHPVAERDHYGFVAQEVQKLFPELVYEDESTGLLSVDYIGMIPILLEGLKAQQKQIVAQQEQIAAILETVGAGQNGLSAQASSLQDLPILYQNTPNPFNESTEIAYYLPTSVQEASLFIYDIHGLQKGKYPIADRGNGTLTIQGSTLDAGSYFYTLLCDGRPVASKQMVLTK